VGWRARTDLGDMSGLVSSIAEIGQLQPIAVRKNGNGMELVAGLRRLTACKELNLEVQAVVVQPEDELRELDMQLQENIRRKNFDMLEIGEGLARRKPLYEAAHPETKHGATGKGRPKDRVSKSDTLSPADRFTRVSAQKLGLAETKVKEALQISELPRKEKLKIEKAGSTAERNKACQEALRVTRVARKRAKLEVAAANRAQGTGQDPAEAKIVLHHMDNRAFFKACKDVRFDVLCTDPPYESDRQSLISHTKRGSIKTDFGDWNKLDVGWVALAEPVIDPGGHLLIFCPLEAIGDYKTVCQSLNLTWHGALVWHRTNPGTVHRPVYLSSVEAVIWSTKPGAIYHFDPFENAGAPYTHNFIEGPICGGKERLSHPTQKPEWLIRRLLKRHAHEFSHVLDPFAGVGTTLAVCHRLGIRCTGVELEADYVTQARLRLAALSKEKDGS
jgi:DNA modification methylase